LETLNVFVNLLEDANIPYYVCGGTLLGSYRHHGLIPWDDDADVCIWKHDQLRVRTALLPAAPAFELVTPRDADRWKFFATSSNTTMAIPGNRYPWRAPFLDICPIVEHDGQYIAETTDQNSPRIKKSMVFPLGWRPFAGQNLRAPHDSLAYLSHFYKLGSCSTYWWSHLREESLPSQTTVACEDLHHIYPFVFRSQAINGQNSVVMETLRVDGIVVNAVLVDDKASLFRL
jgi:hypothetical protein